MGLHLNNLYPSTERPFLASMDNKTLPCVGLKSCEQGLTHFVAFSLPTSWSAPKDFTNMTRSFNILFI